MSRSLRSRRLLAAGAGPGRAGVEGPPGAVAGSEERPLCAKQLRFSPCRNFMVTGLQDIDKCRQQLHDISVPLEVFE